MRQSLFITKVAGQGRQLYLKRDPGTGVSCEFCEIWKSTFFLHNTSAGLLLVLQNRCSYKFPYIYQKIFVLKSLFNTGRALKTRNVNKKEIPTQVFSCEYHKMFKNSCFIEHPGWLLLNMVEEFLIQVRYLYRRIYKREICIRHSKDMK